MVSKKKLAKMKKYFYVTRNSYAGEYEIWAMKFLRKTRLSLQKIFGGKNCNEWLFNLGGNMEKRFCYHPFKKIFFDCDGSHTDEIANRRKTKIFDEFIRGIIKNQTLYLRVYYPYPDINELTFKKLMQQSTKLLKYYQKTIQKIVENQYNTPVKKIVVSVSNTDLKGKLVNV